MPVPPKQYAVGRGVLKPVELTKPLYCEPVGDIDPIMNGPLGGVGSRPKISRRTGRNSRRLDPQRNGKGSLHPRPQVGGVFLI